MRLAFLFLLYLIVKIVKYKDWTFEVDFQRTKEVYERTESGGSEMCECTPCKNFAANKENIFPDEIKELFSNLGIDYKKECETWHMCKLDNGLHHYSAWFHFKGKLIEGKNCIIPTGKETSIFDLTEVNPAFSIGFTIGNALTHFDKTEINELVQIECTVNSEWVIEKELEVD